MMKRIIALLAACLIFTGIFSGCDNIESKDETSASASETAESSEQSKIGKYKGFDDIPDNPPAPIKKEKSGIPEWMYRTYPQYSCYNNQTETLYLRRDVSNDFSAPFFCEALTLYHLSIRTEYIDNIYCKDFNFSVFPKEIFEEKTDLKDMNMWKEKKIYVPYMKYFGLEFDNEEDNRMSKMEPFVVLPIPENDEDILFVMRRNDTESCDTYIIPHYRTWFDVTLKLSEVHESYPDYEEKCEYNQYTYASGFHHVRDYDIRKTNSKDKYEEVHIPSLYSYVPMFLKLAEKNNIKPRPIDDNGRNVVKDSENVCFDTNEESFCMWFEYMESDYNWYRIYKYKNSPQGDVMFYQLGGDLYLAFQASENDDAWITYCFEGYGKWLSAQLDFESAVF